MKLVGKSGVALQLYGTAIQFQRSEQTQKYYHSTRRTGSLYREGRRKAALQSKEGYEHGVKPSKSSNSYG